MPSIHLVIAGRVQGVGFRWFVKERARRLAIAGWVRNRPDGTVEVAGAGDRESLNAFASALRRGPDGARVDQVTELEEISPDSLDGDFSILR
ncbi:MAG TPA: acylphosphatase [Gemmatimonadaceae bacterium]|nr:acylphosphatase [Gemmatimonadaceae bacterium]